MRAECMRAMRRRVGEGARTGDRRLVADRHLKLAFQHEEKLLFRRMVMLGGGEARLQRKHVNDDASAALLRRQEPVVGAVRRLGDRGFVDVKESGNLRHPGELLAKPLVVLMRVDVEAHRLDLLIGACVDLAGCFALDDHVSLPRLDLPPNADCPRGIAES